MGYRVKIVTARFQNPEKQYLQFEMVGEARTTLEITNAKDMDLIELWDDHCVQVIPNTGNPLVQTLNHTGKPNLSIGRLDD